MNVKFKYKLPLLAATVLMFAFAAAVIMSGHMAETAEFKDEVMFALAGAAAFWLAACVCCTAMTLFKHYAAQSFSRTAAIRLLPGHMLENGRLSVFIRGIEAYFDEDIIKSEKIFKKLLERYDADGDKNAAAETCLWLSRCCMKKLRKFISLHAENNIGKDDVKGAVDEVFTYCNDALKYCPGHKDALYALAMYHFEDGKHDEARKCCEQSLRYDATDKRAYCMLGEIAMNSGDYDTAAEQFKHAYKVDCFYAPALVRLTEAYEKLGRHAEAAAFFNKSVLTGIHDDSFNALTHMLSLEAEMVKAEYADFI